MVDTRTLVGEIVLLLGGPLHGAERELTNGESELVIMAPSPGNPIPTPFKYIRRGIQAETRPGMVFEREVLVEQGMPVEIATQALSAVLLERFAHELVRQFMEGGRLVGRSEVGASDSQTDSGNDSTESGLLIARR